MYMWYRMMMMFAHTALTVPQKIYYASFIFLFFCQLINLYWSLGGKKCFPLVMCFTHFMQISQKKKKYLIALLNKTYLH